MLQYHGRLIGLLVDQMPKRHSDELAGEGIKYSWAATKKMSIEIERLVRTCLTREHITAKLILALLWHTRQFICAYDACHPQSGNE